MLLLSGFSNLGGELHTWPWATRVQSQRSERIKRSSRQPYCVALDSGQQNRALCNYPISNTGTLCFAPHDWMLSLARYWISVPPAEGPGTDPDRGLVPANGHPARAPARRKRIWTARAVSGDRRWGRRSMPPTHVNTRSLCGALDCIQRPTLYLHPNLTIASSAIC